MTFDHIIDAILAGNLKEVERLHQKGANINKEDEWALRWACSKWTFKSWKKLKELDEWDSEKKF